MAIIGIDLGTTNSLATVFRNGKPEIVSNALGNTLTPSVAGLDDEGNVIVGESAKERLITHPDLTVAEFKRTMGTDKGYNLGQQVFTSQQLSSIVLKKIKTDAEKYLGEEVEEAVISVPAYFDDRMRSATKQAAELAGIKCERLVNEPSAAALAYLYSHGWKYGTYMVVDFGGGTLDVSIVDSFDQVMEIIAVAGDNQLGGKDFNEAIYNYFCATNGLMDGDLTSEHKAAIYRMAEITKMALTTNPFAVMSVIIDDKEYTATLDNNMLIKIAHSVFERVHEPIRKVLKDSRLSVDELEDIILVGGSCKMPTVAAFIAKVTGKTPCTDIDPDTAIAIGAGVFAGIKSRNEDFKDIVMTDICPFSLGVAILDNYTKDEIMSFIIQRNSMLPTSKVQSYCAVNNNQSQSRFDIFQGESIYPKNNIKLGTLVINYDPVNAGDHTADVRLTYDINGMLMVDVTSKDGVTESKILMGSSRLSQKEIEATKERLEKIKFADSENEEEKLLIARCERIIEETYSYERDLLIDRLMWFKAMMEHGNSVEKRKIKTQFKEFLDGIG